MVQIINGSSNIWIDYNYYSDEPDFDDLSPRYFGRPFQQHDGSVDITNGSDLVTISYNRFEIVTPQPTGLRKRKPSP